MTFESKNLEHFPEKPGVYLMKDPEGNVLYVGKAKHLKNRLKTYFALHGDDRAMIPFLLSEIATIDTLIVLSEKEALLLENTLIKKHKPKYNALLKDDKTFIGILVTTHHMWPMLRLVRYKEAFPKKGLYFGPYVHAQAAREVLDLLSRIFPLRQCSDEELNRRTRPCLLFGMKRCIAPCVGKCTKEEYTEFVEGAIRFLKGQNKEVLVKLHEAMEQASRQLEFEKAASILKTIRQIQEVTSTPEHPVIQTTQHNTDVLALSRKNSEVALTQLFWRKGMLIGSEHYLFHTTAESDEEVLTSFILQHYQKSADLPQKILSPIPLSQKEILEEILHERLKTTIQIRPVKRKKEEELLILAQENARTFHEQNQQQRQISKQLLSQMEEELHLTRFPTRIECFDISTLGGSETVGSMVSFLAGEKDRSRTRRFKIKSAKKGDDYGAMREVLMRRLKRAREEWDLPDLIIVDGGKGQLNVALEILRELEIVTVDAIGLAKEESRHDKGLSQERIFLPHQATPIALASTSPLLFFLQRIRDEAHRLAVQYHRKKRSKSLTHSSLDDIPGIGPIKKKRLLTHFGSVERILQASEQELKKVPGLSKKDRDRFLTPREFKDSYPE